MRPQPLFSLADNPLEINPYDVTADGQHFVTAEVADTASELPHVIVNWTRLLPTSGSGR